MAIVAGVMVAMHLGKVAPALPAIRDELGGDLIITGAIASVVSLVGAIGGLLLGTVANVSNARRMAIAALILLGTASLTGALAISPIQLIVTRSFEGLAIITMAVTAPAIIGRTTADSDRSFGLALWSTYVPTGMTLGILMAVAVLVFSDWRTLWLILGLVTLFFAWLFSVATRSVDLSPQQQKPTIASTIASVITLGPWLLSACFACYAFMWLTLITWMPSFLYGELKLDLATASLATAAMTGVNVAGNFAGALWLRRGRSRLLLISVAMITMAACGWLTLTDGTGTSYRIASGIVFSMRRRQRQWCGGAGKSARSAHRSASCWRTCPVSREFFGSRSDLSCCQYHRAWLWSCNRQTRKKPYANQSGKLAPTDAGRHRPARIASQQVNLTTRYVTIRYGYSR